MLGVVFIIIYFTLHYYTSSLQYFETIPTYAPAVVVSIKSLAHVLKNTRKYTLILNVTPTIMGRCLHTFFSHTYALLVNFS